MISICDVNQETVLDSPLIIQISFEDQLARVSDREPFEVFHRAHQPEF